MSASADDNALDDQAPAPGAPPPRGAKVLPCDGKRYHAKLPKIWPRWMGPCPPGAELVEIRDRKWSWTVFLRMGILAAGIALVAQMYAPESWESFQRVILYGAGVIFIISGLINVGEWVDYLLARQWLVFTPDHIVFGYRTFDAGSREKFRYWANAVPRDTVKGVGLEAGRAGESLFGGAGQVLREYDYWRLKLRIAGDANPFDVEVDASEADMKSRTGFLSETRLLELKRLLAEQGGADADGTVLKPDDAEVEFDLGEVDSACAHWAADRVADWAGVAREG